MRADIIVIIPRLILAFSLGFVIAKPVEIKIFENKINQKIDEVNTLQSAKLKEIERNRLEEIHKKQVNEIAFLKRNPYSSDLVKKSNDNYEQQRDKVQEETKLILEKIKTEDEIGLIGKIQILEDLKKDNPTIEYSSLFITILFIAIDSVPITLKLLCKYSPYDALIETQEENAIYLKSTELSNIERNNNKIKNMKKIDNLSDTILSITVNIPNDKELTGLAEYNSIKNEILQKILQENQKKVLEVLTTNLENQNLGKISAMANNNGNGQQKSQPLNNIST